MLVEVTQPYIVTHQRVAQPELERRDAEIDEIFESRGYQKRLYTLKGQRSYHRWSFENQYRAQERIRNSETRAAIAEYHET